MTRRRTAVEGTRRPRLLILNLYMIHPPDTGAKIILWNRIVELSRTFDITFCCLDEGPVSNRSLQALRPYARVVQVTGLARRGIAARAWDAIREPGVRLFQEPVHGWLSGHEALALRDEPFDLVEVHSSCWHRSELRTFPGLKVLVAHNDEAEYWRAQVRSLWGSAGARLGARLDAWQAERQQRAALTAADAIVALSRRDADRLRPLCGDRPLLANAGGIDCGYYDPIAGATRGHAHELIFIASFFVDAAAAAAKSFACDVLPRIRREGPPTTLRLVGDHRDHPTMLRLRGRPGVQVVGRVDDVRPELARAGIVVVPVSRGSGIRLKLMEACAAGLPIVTTAKGAEGLGLIDGEHALVVDHLDEMQVPIERLLADVTLREQLGANARTLALQRFDRREVCAELAAWYGELLARPGAQPDA